MSEDSKYRVKEGSLPYGNSVAFLSVIDELYSDLHTQFNKAGFDLLPAEMKTPSVLALYPDLVQPKKTDTDADGSPIYQFDDGDPAKGLTSASEGAWHSARLKMDDLLTEYRRDRQRAIDYLFRRCSASAQQDLLTKSEFNTGRINMDHVMVCKFILSVLLVLP